MARARFECVVFPMPALPAGYVVPVAVAVTNDGASVVNGPDLPGIVANHGWSRAGRPAARPLPETYRSRRPCRMFPAVSLEMVASMNVAVTR